MEDAVKDAVADAVAVEVAEEEDGSMTALQRLQRKSARLLEVAQCPSASITVARLARRKSCWLLAHATNISPAASTLAGAWPSLRQGEQGICKFGARSSDANACAASSGEWSRPLLLRRGALNRHLLGMHQHQPCWGI
mmetsp:Transcript_10986/g.36081  ORF Transcript_10986/g.36081 Transcript_10986/m.36081 type:complete len:138 (-) Transcript_10986:442-855(-)